MGSQSDFKVMKEAVKILKEFKIKHEVSIVSAHRTPKRMYDFATSAEEKGFAVIIAGAGMAAAPSRDDFELKLPSLYSSAL